MDLKTRAQNIVTKPAVEWPVIASEHASVGELITAYAVPLAAIPAVCTFLGLAIRGVLVGGLTTAIVSFVFGIVGLYIGALIIEKLAPTFQSRGDTTQALKLIVYAMTPVWIAGVLNLVPGLAVLGIIAALYSIYLFYLGLPHIMHTPESQIIPYMLVSALVVIVVNFCLVVVAGMLTGFGRMF